MDRKLRIAILSDSPMFPTGYSNQAKLLAKHLSDKGHEVHFFAHGYTGATIKHMILEDGTTFNYKIYGQGRAPYFADLMSGLLKNLKIDKFIILLDTFMLHGDPHNPINGWFLRVDTSPAEVYFWYPSDGGGGMPKGCDLILKKVNHPVAMARFGQKQVKDYYNLDTHCIPHGTEKDRFYRLPSNQRDELRAKWGLKDRFVFGTVARNQGRKMLDRTLKAFHEAKDKMPNAVLLMHTDPDDVAQVWEMRELITRYNLENRIVFTGMSALKGFDWNEMNQVYNLMDAFILTTSGEGFGIPIIEAMSVEVPVLVTDYTTTPELVIENNSGLGLNLAGLDTITMYDKNMKDYDNLVKEGTLTGSWNVERGFCSIKDAAEKMIYVYNNPEKCREWGNNGRKAVLEKYEFDSVIGPSWERLLVGGLNAI